MRRKNKVFNFSSAMRELLLSKKLEKITVIAFCDKCNMTRQNFYYYFKSIDDCMMYMLDEDLDLLGTDAKVNRQVDQVFKYVLTNRKLVRRILTDDSAKELFLEYIRNKFRESVKIYLDNYVRTSYNLRNRDYEFVVNYFSFALLSPIYTYAFSEKEPVDYNSSVKFFTQFITSQLSEAVETAARISEDLVDDQKK